MTESLDFALVLYYNYLCQSIEVYEEMDTKTRSSHKIVRVILILLVSFLVSGTSDLSAQKKKTNKKEKTKRFMPKLLVNKTFQNHYYGSGPIIKFGETSFISIILPKHGKNVGKITQIKQGSIDDSHGSFYAVLREKKLYAHMRSSYSKSFRVYIKWKLEKENSKNFKGNVLVVQIQSARFAEINKKGKVNPFRLRLKEFKGY